MIIYRCNVCGAVNGSLADSPQACVMDDGYMRWELADARMYAAVEIPVTVGIKSTTLDERVDVARAPLRELRIHYSLKNRMLDDVLRVQFPPVDTGRAIG